MFHAAPSDGQLQPVADAEPRQVGQRGARLGARAPLSTACRRPLLGAIGALSIWVRAQVVAVGRCGLQTTIAPREDWSRPQQTSTRAMLWHPAQRLFPPKPTGTRIIVGAAGAWLYASGLRGSSFPTYAWSPCGFAGSVAAPARLHERWSAPVGRLLRRSLRRSRPRAEGPAIRRAKQLPAEATRSVGPMRNFAGCPRKTSAHGVVDTARFQNWRSGNWR